MTLSALAGSPGLAWTGPPVAARFVDCVVEYRLATGWDRGIQVGGRCAREADREHIAGRGPRGRVRERCRRSPGSGTDDRRRQPVRLRRARAVGHPGAHRRCRGDLIHLSLSRRAARVGPGGGVTFGTGTGGDGGGWVWTEGRGLRRIPPYSPLHESLTLLSDLAALHELTERSPRTNRNWSVSEPSRRWLRCRHSVGRVTAEPALSPLQRALTRLSALDAARRRFASEAVHTDAGRSSWRPARPPSTNSPRSCGQRPTNERRR